MAEPWQVPAPGTPAPSLHLDLRPLSLGEILDRTFSVYRSRFWLFSGIAAIYAACALAFQLLNLLARHFVTIHYGFRSGTSSALAGSLIMALPLLVPYAITEAALIFALREVYLGNGTTAGNALRATIRRWYRYVGIALWIAISCAWAPLLFWIPAFVIAINLQGSNLAWLVGLLFFLGFCTLPYSVWVLLRNLLAAQVSVVEDAPVRASMRRSKLLTRGARLNIFVVLLVATALTMTAGVLQTPLLFLVARNPLQEHNAAQSISLIVNAFAQMVILPVGLIGLSLIYFDQRVRQEGFDLLLMLGPQPPSPRTPSHATEPLRSPEPMPGE